MYHSSNKREGNSCEKIFYKSIQLEFVVQFQVNFGSYSIESDSSSHKEILLIQKQKIVNEHTLN